MEIAQLYCLLKERFTQKNNQMKNSNIKCIIKMQIGCPDNKTNLHVV